MSGGVHAFSAHVHAGRKSSIELVPIATQLAPAVGNCLQRRLSQIKETCVPNLSGLETDASGSYIVHATHVTLQCGQVMKIAPLAALT
jgi:hypothetical protein